LISQSRGLGDVYKRQLREFKEKFLVMVIRGPL
jgi:hypothetical protein